MLVTGCGGIVLPASCIPSSSTCGRNGRRSRAGHDKDAEHRELATILGVVKHAALSIAEAGSICLHLCRRHSEILTETMQAVATGRLLGSKICSSDCRGRDLGAIGYVAAETWLFRMSRIVSPKGWARARSIAASIMKAGVQPLVPACNNSVD